MSTQSNSIKEIRQYWEDKISNIENDFQIKCIFFSTKNERDYRICNYVVPQSVTDDILQLSNKSNPRLFIVLVSGISLIIRWLSGNSNATLWVPSVNSDKNKKSQNELLPISVLTESGWTWKDLLLGIKNELVDVTNKQNYPIDQLISKYFESAYNFSHDIIVSLENLNDTDFRNKKEYNLLFNFIQTDSEIKGEIAYDANLYSIEIIHSIKDWLINIYSLLPDALSIKLSDLSLIKTKGLEGDYNHSELKISDFNNSRDETVNKLFDKVVNNFPDSIAIKFKDCQISYKELDRISNNLAYELKQYNIGLFDLVGIVLEPSIEFVVSVIAILKLGAAYLPVDKEYPIERIRYMINESNVELVITSTEFQHSFNKIKTICPTIIELREKDERKADLIPINSKLPIYTIYTSGSSGAPKGIIVNNQSVVNYIIWANSYYMDDINKGDFAFFTSIAFDLTVTSIFMPLLSGNRIVIYQSKTPFLALKNILDDDEVDIIKLTPSHLIYINEYFRKNLRLDQSIRTFRLKKIIVGGEQMETSISFSLSKYMNHSIRLYNEYGPTEATVGCIVHEYRYVEDNSQVVPIGKPILNCKIYLINSENKLLPAGFPGEIAIGGDVLSEGYMNRPYLTNEKFIFLPETNDYVYKTGDIAGIDKKTGIYTYLGRADKQVKIRGMRIEPNEIKYALLKITEIEECAVLENEGSIIAFVKTNKLFDNDYFINYLSKFLPSFMLPDFFVQIKETPLTRNGKLDEQLLLGVYKQQLQKKENVVVPQTLTQKKIAKIWEEVLNIKGVNIYDNFFKIGGNSIRIMDVNASLEGLFDLSIPLTELFENPSIYDQAKYIDSIISEASREEGIESNVKK